MEVGRNMYLLSVLPSEEMVDVNLVNLWYRIWICNDE